MQDVDQAKDLNTQANTHKRTACSVRKCINRTPVRDWHFKDQRMMEEKLELARLFEEEAEGMLGKAETLWMGGIEKNLDHGCFLLR